MRRYGTIFLAGALALGGCTAAKNGAGNDDKSAISTNRVGTREDYDQAKQFLDAGDIPAAVAPLKLAATMPPGQAPIPIEEIGLLATQAEVASRDETVDMRIADMKDAPFEAYVERGELTKIPYYHDPRIDEFFRKALLAKRPMAREIRAARRK